MNTTFQEVKDLILEKVEPNQLMKAFGEGLLAGAIGKSIFEIWNQQIEKYQQRKMGQSR